MLMDNHPRFEPAVLTSWKEIAQHLGKGVRTVQRWEQRYGLPVRRPLGAGHKSTVLASRNDLDRWMTSAWGQRSKSDKAGPHVAFLPLFNRLECAIENSKTLQTSHQGLLREMSRSLQSLVLNCRELRKNRKETQELLARSIEAQFAVLELPPPGMNLLRKSPES